MKVFPSARPSLTQADVKVDPKADLTKARKIALYGTFSWTGQLSQRHFDHCAALRKAGYFVIACRAAERHGKASNAVTIGDVDILKPNIGYDFGSWWFGLQWLTNERLNWTPVEHVCLMNDSFFGMADSNALAKVEGLSGALCGFSESRQEQRHLQSFLAVVKTPFIQDGFLDFLKRYPFPESKEDAVTLGEFGLTNLGNGAGHKPNTLLAYDQMLEHWVSNVDQYVGEELEARSILGLPIDRPSVEASFDWRIRDLLQNKALCPHHNFWRSYCDTDGSIFKRDLIMNVPKWCADPYALLRTLAQSDVYEQVVSALRDDQWNGPDIKGATLLAMLQKFRQNG